MRLDFVEKFTNNPVFSGDMFGVSLIAYEAYAKVIGARQLRIMNPENDKLINYPGPRYSEQEINSGILINTLRLNVAMSCNMRCSYCYVETNDYQVMDWNIAKKSLDIFFVK